MHWANEHLDPEQTAATDPKKPAVFDHASDPRPSGEFNRNKVANMDPKLGSGPDWLDTGDENIHSLGMQVSGEALKLGTQ